jgi:uncharacterized protein (TIGR02145 family)
VGEYISLTEISFTGTPVYEISLTHPDKGSATVKSGDTFLLPCDYTLTSFSDATGAPGIMRCIPMSGSIDFTNPAVSKNQQASFVVSREPTLPNPASITYCWSAPGFSPATYEGRTFTATVPNTPGTYSVTLTAQGEKYCDLTITKDVEVINCTVPGSTVNFTAFVPCDAATGATWTLQDTREPNNPQNYKVKKMADGHIWMVQDMKFGDLCSRTTFTGSSGKDMQGRVSSTFPLYYGDCMDMRNVSIPANRGYLYDFSATLNAAGAYNGGSSNVGCSGVGASANACQGICPDGWHVPTALNTGELYALASVAGYGCTALNGCALWGQNTVFEASQYSGYEGGLCATYLGNTSTTLAGNLYHIYCYPKDGCCDNEINFRPSAGAVRCLRNY